MDIASKVKDLIKESVEKEGYILDKVEYVKEDGNYYLRVIIDKNGIVDPMLDDIDYITDSYILDVCSKEKGVD